MKIAYITDKSLIPESLRELKLPTLVLWRSPIFEGIIEPEFEEIAYTSPSEMKDTINKKLKINIDILDL